ncbi:unnamed protein product, partial [Iphiclides podalirius]
MVRLLTVQIIVFIALAVVADALVKEMGNKTLANVNNDLKKLETRRRLKKKKKSRSTSSSSREKKRTSSEESGESLKMSVSSDSSSSDLFKVKKKRVTPKSSLERKGWRKWHRKCPKCPEDMVKKWRDPSIKWICGAYQRARRSFKSECMMHYRNCQDGTMFVEIHKGRCKNDSRGDPQPHGDHFFYEYRVEISGDSTSDGSRSTSSKESREMSTSYEEFK